MIMNMSVEGWIHEFRLIRQDERGISFMVMMIIVLLTGVLGVAALTMTGLENSMAGAIRMVEEGTHAAESCVGTSVNVIQQSIDSGTVPPTLIAPQGPVPAANAMFLGQEINGVQVNNPDTAVGTGSNPNIVLNVNNYVVNGDIDFQYRKQKSGGASSIAAGYDGTGTGAASVDLFYRVDCTAVNAATGTTSRVIAVYDCLASGDGCTRRTY
jgi:Tfp pilus assembly protein PilX